MIRIRFPHRFPLLAAAAFAFVWAAAPAASGTPAAAPAPTKAQTPAWLMPPAAPWLPLSWVPLGRTRGEPVAASSQTAGLRVTLDPVTRKPVRPTAEQRRALQADMAPSAPDAPLRTERLPGGGELVHLDGRYMVFSVVRRDASGRFVRSCAADSIQAAQVVARPLPAPRGREER